MIAAVDVWGRECSRRQRQPPYTFCLVAAPRGCGPAVCPAVERSGRGSSRDGTVNRLMSERLMYVSQLLVPFFFSSY